MPTRVVREGILTSEKVNALTERAELFYRRLMSVVDDYGRYFSHPSLIRAACYALRLDAVSEADVKQMLNECIAQELVTVYGGGKYIEITNFKQQTRSPSKFPQPSDNELLIKPPATTKAPATANVLGGEGEGEGDKPPLPPSGGVSKGPLQLRAEKLFRRKPETPFDQKEVKAFKKNKAAIEATSEDDWKILEKFYALPQTDTFSRKDLATLLNNWNGEIDRAKKYFEKQSGRNGGTLNNSNDYEGYISPPV